MACAVRLLDRKARNSVHLSYHQHAPPRRPAPRGKKRHLHLPIESQPCPRAAYQFPRATRFAQVDDPLAAAWRLETGEGGVRACSGWMRRQRGGGGRRGPTCLYAPLRARPMPTPPRARTASSPDPSQGRTDRDASSSSPAGPARPATTCSRCLAWRAAPCSAPLQVGPRAAALPLRPSPCRAPFAFGFGILSFVPRPPVSRFWLRALALQLVTGFSC